MFGKKKMKDEVISLRVGKELRRKMKMYEYLNWSAIVRRALVEEMEKMHVIDKKKAMEAARDMDKIRKSGVFDSERTGTEIIREWRDKRR
jgi:hypothetical protein